MSAAALLAVALGAALFSAVTIPLLLPLLKRYALARPNARSSHKVPTPQGAGLCVVVAILAAAGAARLVTGAAFGAEMLALGAGVMVLALAGALDDLRELGVAPRLVAQVIAVALVVIVTLQSAGDATLFPSLPRALEIVLAILAGVWFVNLTNFMDGIDGMTAVNGIVLAAAICLASLAGGGLSGLPQEIAAALGGALAGFLVWNRPVARVFLGDVGSLPIGLVSAWLLFKLALSGSLVAALILPLYPVLDASLTLARRLIRGERIWIAHRDHAYQHAVDRGVAVTRVLGAIALADAALAYAALTALALGDGLLAWALFAAALVGTAAMLRFLDGPNWSRR